MKIGILASHFGSTLQALIDAARDGRLCADIQVVISNNRGSEALKRAERAGIRAVHLSGKTHPKPDELDQALVVVLREAEVELVVLAGYMKKLGLGVIRAFPRRIVNTHPALLPKYGGQGMYGMSVHEAVVRAGESESGVTIHLVDEQYDSGPTVAQRRVAVLSNDDATTLAARVQQAEKELLVETLDGIGQGRVTLPD
jgi:phosphoribosylglycinamide formyltransferase-1